VASVATTGANASETSQADVRQTKVVPKVLLTSPYRHEWFVLMYFMANILRDVLLMPSCLGACHRRE
jgi:hypothetical protein